jgi:signal transduction histidine kinase
MEAEDELTEGHPIDLSSASALLAHAEDEWRKYNETPDFPGEEAGRHAVEPKLAQLRHSVRATIHALERDDLATARSFLRGDLKHSFKEVGQAMLVLIRLNNEGGHLAALRAEESRKTSLVLAIIMGALALVVTGLLGWAVASGMRRIAHLQERRTAELESFSARVSHDLRGPLSTALLGCDLAERGDGRQIERIRRSLRRMTALVNDLYTFARLGVEAPTVGPTPLRAAVESALEEIAPKAQEAGMSMTTETLPECQIAASPGVVHSVLANLLGNTVKHAGAGAHVMVRARVADRLHVEVEDDGPGIPTDIRAHVFDPYVRGNTVRDNGLGLGLATVKRLVERHGGSCGVRPAEKHGALFWFELPIVRSLTADT